MTYFQVHGVNVPLSQNDVSPVIWAALEANKYEAKEAHMVLKAVKPNDRVLELGCGIAIITCIIAKIDGVQVHAFEANPVTALLATRVVEANNADNIVIQEGILAVGDPHPIPFYVREDLWMSSTNEAQGAFQKTLTLTSSDLDKYIDTYKPNALVMDIEGAERELLTRARLNGVERIFVELHDHLYGLEGIRDITRAMAVKGYSYDPRGSQGACVLFSNDDGERQYEES